MAHERDLTLVELIHLIKQNSDNLTGFAKAKVEPAIAALKQSKLEGTPSQVSEDSRKWLMCL